MNWRIALSAVASWVLGTGGLYTGCGPGYAQGIEMSTGGSLLPLSVGNRWEYMRVSQEVWSEMVVAVIEVKDRVRFLRSSADTSSVGEEKEYYEVHFSGWTYLFPYPQPKALFVRQDEDGNVWTCGYLDGGQIHLTTVDQPWLMKTQWNWIVRMDHWGVGVMEFFRLECVGIDEERGEIWKGCDAEGEYLEYWGDIARISSVRRLIPEFELGGPWSLMEVSGIKEGLFDQNDMFAFFVTGVGPIQMIEPLGFEPRPSAILQLVRAEVDGRQYSLSPNTAVQESGWGEFKRRFPSHLAP
ncbi:MAG: hypothetical protein ABIN58_10275 [candidate division WOR-3 bacterium]